jgi:hypothetical protein
MAERRGAARRGGGTLAVLAKAPIPGFAKTRLIPRLGPEGAAELHAILLKRTLRTAMASGFASVELWCAPSREAPFFEALRAGSLELRDQPEGDLGARMLAAFESQLAGGGPAVLVGTDCPQISSEHLWSARAALARGADAVVLPAADGGYAAIGLARVDRRLFAGMPWGSSGVMAETRERLRQLGWAAHELAPVRDVDLPEDVDWLLASGLLDGAEREAIARHLR